MPDLWQTSYLAAVHCPPFWPRDVALVIARDTPSPPYSFSNHTASPLSAPALGRNPAFCLTGKPWMRLLSLSFAAQTVACPQGGPGLFFFFFLFLVLLLYLFFIIFFPGCDLLIFLKCSLTSSIFKFNDV